MINGINTDMLFNNLVDKLGPFMLNEKYYTYSIPTIDVKGDKNLVSSDTNQYIMYDFYVLNYLKFLIDEMTPKQFRDLSPDLESSVQDAVNKLFPYLREELLNAVFYAICAEMRHSDVFRDNRKLVEDNSKLDKLYKTYLKYVKFHTSSAKDEEDAQILYNVRQPKSEVRIPESEVNNDKNRNISYKGANYAIKKLGLQRSDFVELAKYLYDNGIWNSSYGGKAWARICNGWQILNVSDKLTPQTKQSLDSAKKPMGVAIDHVYDLQHNTDTVFNKLKSYYSTSKGYGWIKTALDHKANVKSYYELLQHTSGTVRAMDMPVLYNRLGSTWESDIKKTNPDKLYTPKKEPEKEEDIPQQPLVYSGDIKAGDTVKAQTTMGSYITKGLDYIVVEVKINDSGNPIVKLEDNYGHQTWVSEDSVLKYTPPPKSEKLEVLNIEDINLGDEVVSLVDESIHLTKGKKYKVDEKFLSGGGHYLKLIGDTGQVITKFIYKIKKPDDAPDSSKNKRIEDLAYGMVLKTGDKLIGKPSLGVLTHRKNIKPGVVVTYIGPDKIINNANAYVDVELNGKKSTGFHHSAFAKVISQPKAPSAPVDRTPKPPLHIIEVGDIVKCVDDSGWASGKLTVGKTYKVIRIGIDMEDIEVMGDNGHRTTVFTSRFVKVQDKPKRVKTPDTTSDSGVINAGDYVECIDAKGWSKSYLTKGKIYQVISVDSYTDSIYLIADTNTKVNTYLKKFKKVPDIKI